MATARVGPLADVLVVDFSRVLSGPFATMLMSDLGARVIKVENPVAGDDSRGYGPFADGESMYFARVNRGKESIALDLKSAVGLETAKTLCATADVVVENFRPGVMERLGLAPEKLLEANPKLVVASISGFGQTGPWRERPAYDAVVQGLSGLIAITGRPGEEPVKPGAPIADLSAGIYAFGGICAALLDARSTGKGTHLDVAMYDASLSLLEGAALRFLVTGQDPPLIGNAHHAIAPFDSYRTADGVMTICAANDALWGALCAVIEAPELLSDSRYATNALRHENLATLGPDLERHLATRPSAEWLRMLEKAGVPCGSIAGVGEAVTSEQAIARNMVIDAGGLRVPGQALKFSTYDDPTSRLAAPKLDEHGARIRAEFRTARG